MEPDWANLQVDSNVAQRKPLRCHLEVHFKIAFTLLELFLLFFFCSHCVGDRYQKFIK